MFIRKEAPFSAVTPLIPLTESGLPVVDYRWDITREITTSHKTSIYHEHRQGSINIHVRVSGGSWYSYPYPFPLRPSEEQQIQRLLPRDAYPLFRTAYDVQLDAFRQSRLTEQNQQQVLKEGVAERVTPVYPIVNLAGRRRI